MLEGMSYFRCHILLQQEDLVLLQQEDLVLLQQEDLILLPQEDLILLQEDLEEEGISPRRPPAVFFTKKGA